MGAPRPPPVKLFATFLSEVVEAKRFDVLFFSTLLAYTTSERKIANSFTGGGRGGPMVMPRPHPSGSK